MEIFLLIIILLMVLVTMICSIITTIIEVKDEHEQPLVKKALGISSIAIIIVLVIALAFGVSTIKKDDNKSNDSNETVALESAGFNEVTLDEYLNLVNGQDKSIILVARPTCSYCEAFAPILSEAADDLGLTINYIDTDKFSSDDWTTFNESLDYLSENEWGTPLTLIVQNGEVVDANNGYVELDDIKTFFTDNGLGE
ncbi:MAG TPA: conjugal transfer protein TraF [Candidatus Aphodocola excrementigallinarum]|uniref:Conjugal transfer protein TraF n=1 Tax=Candidatus Aphodocola excrementigallinarum TaxID=2840670 RepID=A0A9D1IPW4_9FIRM|nr:conjugal transfer protein TraF [Candidatus Aphodocola excrementigallinarum]